MKLIERYLLITPEGQRVLVTQKPESEHEIIYQLTADAGKLLINGRVGLKAVETYDSSVWYEVDDPGDERYNQATIEDYKEMLRTLGVEV